jgi:predicted nucleotidyltransferase
MREAASIVRRIVGPLPVRVFLFGSRALGTGRPTSDIDLALLSDDPLPADLVARLKGEFEESTIPYTVDVIDLSQVDEPLRERVWRERRCRRRS